MKSASSQLTKIADLGCNMFLCISFLSSSLYKLHSTRLAQVCSFQSTSPQAKIALWRGKSFFISMKCSFPSMVWISHEFSFAKMDNFMPVAKWSQACAFTQSCFLWNLLLNLALSFVMVLLVWQLIFQVCQSWKTVKKHLIFSTGRIRTPRGKCSGENQVISAITRGGQPYPK